MGIINKLVSFLKGKKTYICAAGLFLTYGAKGTGLISEDVATVLIGLFTGGGLAALRLAK